MIAALEVIGLFSNVWIIFMAAIVAVGVDKLINHRYLLGCLLILIGGGWIAGKTTVYLKLKWLNNQMPMYPGSEYKYRMSSKNSGETWYFECVDSPDKVIEFYRNAKPKNGWRLYRWGKMGIFPVLLFEKDDYILHIHAGKSMRDMEGATSISFARMKRDLFAQSILGSWAAQSEDEIDPKRWERKIVSPN